MSIEFLGLICLSVKIADFLFKFFLPKIKLSVGDLSQVGRRSFLRLKSKFIFYKKWKFFNIVYFNLV